MSGRTSVTSGGLVRRGWYAYLRWLYPNQHPRSLAKALNAISARHFASGVLAPPYAITLEVRGRRSGRVISLPLVLVMFHAHRYLVAMLGEHVNWVRNVQVAGGHAVIVHHRREPVILKLVPVEERAPVLRRYLDLAPGARPHIPVDRGAPLAEFAAVADRYPVFRVETDHSADADVGE
jgi:F420H(2)-dependent quinone reductase